MWSPSRVHRSDGPLSVLAEGFCQAVFAQKVGKWRSLWRAISGLPHLQTQALLLRFCASFCKVVHLLRTVPPHLLGPCLPSFDREFRSFMEEVTGPTTDFVWAWMSLGYGEGGLAQLLSTLLGLPLQLGGFCPSPSFSAPSDASKETPATARLHSTAIR